VLLLAVNLVDVVAKNGNAAVWDTIGGPEIASPLRELAEGNAGKEVQTAACALVQDLALGLPSGVVSSRYLPFPKM
jgi:hypothetical protein